MKYLTINYNLDSKVINLGLKFNNTLRVLLNSCSCRCWWWWRNIFWWEWLWCSKSYGSLVGNVFDGINYWNE